jgi:hypothetical protein
MRDDDLTIKLFDTLKESHSNVEKKLEKQTDAIVVLSDLLKLGVKPEEIKKVIEDHHTYSGEHLDNINTCTETINDNSSKILSLIKSLNKRVTTMILVVCITFSIMTISYLFVRSSVQSIVKEAVKTEKIVKENATHNHTELSKQIEEIRKLIKGFHKDEINGLNKKNI